VKCRKIEKNRLLWDLVLVVTSFFHSNSCFLTFLLYVMQVLYKVLILWFPKKYFYRFSGLIRTFYRRKPDFYEKKLPSAVISSLSNENFCIFNVKKYTFRSFFLWNWKSFLQLFSKLNRKHVISFMNLKSFCGDTTYFYSLFWKKLDIHTSKNKKPMSNVHSNGQKEWKG
jgi:hypothetical protein